MDNIIVVGLGNPGFEYEETRHNVGFMVVDEVSVRWNVLWRPGKGEYLFCTKVVEGKNVVLVKPLTYMNNSGEALLEVMERFPAPVRNIVAVVDDIELPLGTIRVRRRGSDGGHNGLRSLIYHLNTDEFPRIRCGIRKEVKPPKHALADFVLSPFDAEEKGVVEEMIKNAAGKVEEFVRSSNGSTQGHF